MLPACCSPGQDALKGSSPRGSVWPCPVVTPAHPHTHSPKTPHLQPRCCSAPCPSHGREDRAPEQQRRCFPSQQQECKTSAHAQSSCVPGSRGWVCWGHTHCPACSPHVPSSQPSLRSSHSSRNAQWAELSQRGLGECELSQQQSQPRGLSPNWGHGSLPLPRARKTPARARGAQEAWAEQAQPLQPPHPQMELPASPLQPSSLIICPQEMKEIR